MYMKYHSTLLVLIIIVLQFNRLHLLCLIMSKREKLPEDFPTLAQ